MFKIPSINISDFAYTLPEEKIAKYPLQKRDRAKLLVCKNDSIYDKYFYNLPELIKPGTLLVINNTKVIHARMNFYKKTGAKIEIFCLEPMPDRNFELAMKQTGHCTWKCLVGNAKKWKDEKLELKINSNAIEYLLKAEKMESLNGCFLIRFAWIPEYLCFSSIIESAGMVPLPPYIHRPAENSDNLTYQTVYAENNGSVAAPTAGLHFTPELLLELSKNNIQKTHITLHVGAGTFKPVSSESIEQHIMHSEQVVIKKQLLNDMLNATGEIIAVGTTSVRSLESLYYLAAKIHETGEMPVEINQWDPYNETLNALDRKKTLMVIKDYMDKMQLQQISFITNIIIIPGYRFKMTDGMVTNFHQPRSTLLLLIAAYLGDSWKEIYKHALGSNYRFLSYGDACLFLK
ncbi:MAG: S-adenosylmethionine:tRNA ribosyltransferase-isomerase [Bacteroidales bacterium]|jgi:S-adenosylmethionine:tRNA ribosyltransferase-isomerase|nr:S-adenosylmethionine:tRNA ribosyltransferase-isomerase [Bacteroidales bacterium]